MEGVSDQAAHALLSLQVPQDLSIVGFDDSAAASLVWPALTTVRQPVGATAARRRRAPGKP